MNRALLLAVLLAASAAFADNTADEADIAFSLGNTAYAKRDYERALSQYFLSYRLVPNRNVLFNIAKCYEALDRLDEAYRYWHDLSLEQGLSDEDRREVRSALARLTGKVALISVVTNPPGADLYVDREDLGSRGRTPQTVAVSPGAHTVIVKLAGYRNATAKTTVGRGRESKQTLELTRIVGKVQFEGTPAGAIIRETADGPELGRLPATLDFTPGQRLLIVQAPGHLPSQVLVDVKADTTAVARVNLTEKPRPTGKVIVTANRDNAIVRVDGKDQGFTPVVLTLVEGEHEIEVTTSEVTPLVKQMNVVADSETRLNAELRYAPPAVRAASKSLLSVDQAPASVTVITREEIQGFGFQTVTEALEAVRGFFLTDDRIYTYIGIRGFSPPGDLNTRVLILYDGHSMNDVWAGQGFSARDLDVDLSEIDRIEVVRGPTSTLYGTGAIFGVINVVPRDRLAEGRHVEGTTGTGGQGGVKARLTGSLGGPSASLLVSAAAFNSSGADLTDLGERGVVLGLDGERSLGASLRGKAGDFSLTGKFNQRLKQVPTAPHGSDVGVPGTSYLDTRAMGELRFEHAWGRVTLNARASYDLSRFRGSYARHDPPGTEDIVVDHDTGGADWFGGELRATITLFQGNRLTVAAEAQQQYAFQQPVGFDKVDPHARTLLSATLVDEWQIFSRLSVQLGARADKYLDLPDIALSPRGAVVFKPYSTGLTKLVAGQAFRAPNAYELYFQDNWLTQRVPTLPLRPELITSFELEHSHDVTPELRVTAGGYYNLIDRLVVLNEDPPETLLCGTADEPQTMPCVVYANSSGRLTAIGAEGELRWQPGRFTLVDASYSYVLLRQFPAAAEGEEAIYPTHLASLRALVPIKEGVVRLSGQLTYQSSRRSGTGTNVGEALLLNLGISGEYGQLRYFAGVRNLLDQHFSLPVASEAGFETLPQYGRSFWLEVSAGF